MAPANPNTFEYWMRAGTIMLPGTLGKVAGTGDFEYWMRAGTIIFQPAIQKQPATTISGSTLLSLGVG